MRQDKKYKELGRVTCLEVQRIQARDTIKSTELGNPGKIIRDYRL